jgi:hypothetical protein
LFALNIPVIDPVPDPVSHNCTFWGIGFPSCSLPFDFTAINIVQEYLESGWHFPIVFRPEGLNKAAVVSAIKLEGNGKSVLHGFSLPS